MVNVAVLKYSEKGKVEKGKQVQQVKGLKDRPRSSLKGNSAWLTMGEEEKKRQLSEPGPGTWGFKGARPGGRSTGGALRS